MGAPSTCDSRIESRSREGPGPRVCVLGASAWLGAAMTACTGILPGDRFQGELSILDESQRTAVERLRDDVHALAGRIGERNVFRPEAYAAAEDFLGASLARAGHRVRWQTFEVRHAGAVHHCSNLFAEVRGYAAPNEIVIVGAHYDTVRGTPGADDNASGCAAVLELARRFAGAEPGRTIRFVFFANEEPPFFWTDQMGSLVHAREARERGEHVAAMLSLETLGWYSEREGSQRYPPLVGGALPSSGDFVAFVGHESAAGLVARCVETFRGSGALPCEGAAMPSLVPRIGSSDHWSFWKQGWPALMVTDTAPYRNPNYHRPTDTPDTLDYERLARVVDGLEAVIGDLARVDEGAPASTGR
jgi:hypothetical protein